LDTADLLVPYGYENGVDTPVPSTPGKLSVSETMRLSKWEKVSLGHELNSAPKNVLHAHEYLEVGVLEFPGFFPLTTYYPTTESVYQIK
jgi:hypothetical protein